MRAAPLLPMALLSLLAACQQPPDPLAGTVIRDQSSKPIGTSPPQPPPALTASLAGAWRVAAIDGKQFDESYGLALTGDEEKLWWEPRCAGMARRYLINRNTVTFTPLNRSGAVGSPTPPVCAIGLPPRLREVFQALDDAKIISQTQENGIYVGGPKHSLLLFSQ